MSTRSIIAEVAGDGFRGRYCHSDGYPTWQLGQLHRIITETFNGDVKAALAVLLGEQSWSQLDVGTTTEGPEWMKQPGMEDMPSRYKFVPGVGYAHNDHNEPDDETWWLSYHGEPFVETDTEWAYAFDAVHDRVSVFTIDRVRGTGVPFASVPVFVGAYNLATLDTSEEGLTAIECGPNFERCGHMATAHIPEAPYVTMDQWLGRAELTWREIAAVIIKGRTYVTRGGTGQPGRYWDSSIGTGKHARYVRTVEWRNGEPVPAPGVKWVMPTVPAR